MRSFFKWFIDQPMIVNLLTVLIFMIGLVSVYTLQKETFPKVEFGVITISTAYPGSSSEDVEKMVTIPIERAIKGISGFKSMNAISTDGRSIFTIMVDADFDVSEVYENIQTSVDSVTDLPEDVEAPLVKEQDNKARATLKIAVTGEEGVDYNKLRMTAKDLRDHLENYHKVSTAEMSGYEVDEIRIEINPGILNKYDLTAGEIASAITNRNINLSAGKIQTPAADIMVRTVSEFKNEHDIKEVVIRSNDSGYNLKVKDVATVVRSPSKNARIHRAQGRRAIFLNIKIKPNADVIRSTNKIKEKTEKFFERKKYDGVSYSYIDDMSIYVKRRLGVLSKSGYQGIVLVFVCLLFFLNFSTSVVTSLGAPVAFLTSFALMQYFGISINLISMFALILVLGMLVDDSIIVAEHFYQKLEAGEEPKKAALDAAMETYKPVLATILTTIVAFGALFFMGGIMGKFLWPVPVVVIICLLASLFECFVILPSHLAEFCKISKRATSDGPRKRWYDSWIRRYGQLLKKVLAHPFIILLIFLLVFLSSIGVATKMRFELFPGDDVRIVFMTLKGKVGDPLVKTDNLMKTLEKIAMNDLKKNEYEQIRTIVGQGIMGEHSSKYGSHYGTIILYLTPPNERERSTDSIVNEINKLVKLVLPKGVTFSINKLAGGPPKGKPVEIEVTGPDLARVKIAAKEVRLLLAKEEGITSTEIDFEEGASQIIVDVDEQEVKRLGLSTTQVAMELRRVFGGDKLTQIRGSDEDIKIKLALDSESIARVDSLEKLFILNKQGQRISINTIAKLKKRPGAFVIRRLNRRRVISVSASIDKNLATPVKIAKMIDPKLHQLFENYPSLNYKVGGENEDTKESMDGLKRSALIALCCIFFILVVMFGSLGQPLVVMSAIPLGLIGVIWAFLIMGSSLGFMAFMGVVGLIGVVVNDSIVLVTFINETRKKGGELLENVRLACMERFRPVILTTFTTVAGLLPVAHAPGGDPFIKPMAQAFAWGLLFASMVTLFFIPSCYIAYVKSKEFFERVIGKLKSLLLKGGHSLDIEQ